MKIVNSYIDPCLFLWLFFAIRAYILLYIVLYINFCVRILLKRGKTSHKNSEKLKPVYAKYMKNNTEERNGFAFLKTKK